MEIFWAKLAELLSPGMIYSGFTIVIIYIFRESVLGYLEELVADYRVYKNRRVDDDGDPKSGQFCTVESKTDDLVHHIYYVQEYMWGKIQWIRPSNRRIKVWKYLESIDKWVPTKLTYRVWASYTIYNMPQKNIEMKKKLIQRIKEVEEDIKIKQKLEEY